MMRNRKFLKFYVDRSEHFGREQQTVDVLVFSHDLAEVNRLRLIGIAAEHVRNLGHAGAVARRFDASAIVAAGFDSGAVAILKQHSPRVVVAPSTAGIHHPRDLAAMVAKVAA